jgi:hypothetical protein
VPDLFDLIDEEAPASNPLAKTDTPPPATLERMEARGHGQPCARPWTGAPEGRCAIGGGGAGYGIGSVSYCPVHVPVGFFPRERGVIPRGVGEPRLSGS